MKVQVEDRSEKSGLERNDGVNPMKARTCKKPSSWKTCFHDFFKTV
jgi:hypothetical protein